MNSVNKTSLFSLLLFCTLITLVSSTFSMSPEDQPAAQNKEFCMMGGGGVQVGSEVANGILTVSLPASELAHLLTCSKNERSWIARCERCQDLKVKACSTMAISFSQFQPTQVTFNSQSPIPFRQ